MGAKITVIDRDLEHGITGTRLDAALFNPMIFGHLSSKDEHGHQDYGWESVIAYGADPTGAEDSAEAFEDAAAGSGIVLVPAGTYKIATNLTIAKQVLFLSGAILNIESGIDVSLNVCPGSSIDQHFNCALGDTPALQCDVCYPEWFGVDPDNAAGAFAKAIASAHNILLPNDYTCTDGLMINKEELTVTVNGTITFSSTAASFFTISSANTQICGTGKIVGSDETLIIGEAGKWPFMTIDNVDGLAGELSDIAEDIGDLVDDISDLDGRIDDLETQFISGDISVDVTSTYFSTPVNATWKYKKNTVTNEVSILIPDMFGHHTTCEELQFTPNTGNWPATIIPATAQMVKGGLFSKEGNPSNWRLGMLNIPNATNSNIVAYMADSTGEMLTNSFGKNDTQPKGIFRQTIHYIAE